jgi:hypothetical protein
MHGMATKTPDTGTDTTPEIPAIPALPEIPDMTDLVNDQIRKLEAKAEELRPAAEAFEQVQGMIASFVKVRDGKNALPGTRAPRGTRNTEFLTIVREAGDAGITVAEAGRAMGLENNNYLYRIAKDMAKEGLVEKVDRDGETRIVATAETPAEATS